MLTFEPTFTRYCIEIEAKAFTAMLDAEEILGRGEPMDSLSDSLEKLPGVNEVEYNGHFGANVFLSLDSDIDSPAAREALGVVIEQHLAAAKKWKR